MVLGTPVYAPDIKIEIGMFSQTCFLLIDFGYVNKHSHSVCVPDKW